MSETAESRQWRVARAPDYGDLSVVFRKDDRASDEEGPQIVMTGSPLSDYNDEAGWRVPYGAEITFEYQIWDSNKRIKESTSHSYTIEYDAPFDPHGEPETLEPVIEIARNEIEDYAANPSYLNSDGWAASLL